MPNKHIYGVYFASWNKDNQDVPNFQERRKVFLSTRSVDELMLELKHFVNMGQPGEFIQDAIDASAKHGQEPIEVEVRKTPNGQAVIASHGFDSGEFSQK